MPLQKLPFLDSFSFGTVEFASEVFIRLNMNGILSEQFSSCHHQKLK